IEEVGVHREVPGPIGRQRRLVIARLARAVALLHAPDETGVGIVVVRTGDAHDVRPRVPKAGLLAAGESIDVVCVARIESPAAAVRSFSVDRRETDLTVR